jgi:hypothetical protein
MGEMPTALPHGELQEVFPDVFIVTGAMKTVLMEVPWQFSRNMTVVREGQALTLINAIRLDDAGLAKLEALGRVANVVKIASWHGRDDAFYKVRFGAAFWALPGMQHEHDLATDKELTPGGNMPFAGCSLFDFRTAKRPEGILHIDRAGGILVSGDSLQNYLAPDEYFSDDSRKTMTEMGFFQYGNYGPLWMQLNEPPAEDFVRLLELPFEHLLPGHGSVLRNWAKEAFAARFLRVFGSSPSAPAARRPSQLS